MLSSTILTSFFLLLQRYYFFKGIFNYINYSISQTHITLYLGDDFYTATLYHASNKSAVAIGLPRFAARATSL